MKSTTIVILAAILFLSVSCQRVNPSRTHRAVIEAGQDLRILATEWDRLFNLGDAAKLSALYAEDVVSMPPNAPTLQGRKAVEADFQSFFAANVARHQTVVDEIVREGDLAIERAHYRLTYRPRAGGAEIAESGRHLECRRKIGGEWKIVLEIWNSDAPPPK
jgi:ketosteroid isomerase-like protein